VSDRTEAQASLAVGTWIGREQAFNALAHHCSAARVACLKQIRDTAAYMDLNVTWDEFCPEHAGISRTQADRLIRRLAEFGVPYFQLTDIVPVSPAVYREIAPAISGGAVEFRGEQIPVTPENAAKIKAAVSALRKDAERARSDARIRVPPGITSLQIRLDACCEDIRRLIQNANDIDTQAGLRGLLSYSAGRLNQLSQLLPNP